MKAADETMERLIDNAPADSHLESSKTCPEGRSGRPTGRQSLDRSDLRCLAVRQKDQKATRSC
jgi:hypothetical protein